MGRPLVTLLAPGGDDGPAAASDSTVLAAHGGVWPKKHRAAGIVPHPRIATAAGGPQSGWHGWVYGGKLPLVPTVAGVWLPLAATLTPAKRADNEEAPTLVAELPPAGRFLRGDTAYNAPALREWCAAVGGELGASKRGVSPQRAGGLAVRRRLHHRRAHAIENVTGQCKAIFAAGGQVPRRGLRRTQRYVLGAVFVDPLPILARSAAATDLRCGLLAYLRAA